MSIPPKQTPAQPEDERPVIIQRQPDTAKSEAHIGQLLSIAGHCAQNLFFETEVGHTVDADPALREETKKTFELVHSRLRDLIDENARWSLEPAPLEKALDELTKSNAAYIEEKRKGLANLNRPSVTFSAKIGHFAGVGWVARIGDGLPTDTSWHGIGETPEKAMQAFDDAFTGKNITISVVPPEPPPPAPEPPKKRSRKRSEDGA